MASEDCQAKMEAQTKLQVQYLFLSHHLLTQPIIIIN